MIKLTENAFISVGEFGRKSKFDIISKNSFSAFFTSPPYFLSAEAIFFATLLNISSGVSITFPLPSFLRYLFSKFQRKYMGWKI